MARPTGYSFMQSDGISAPYAGWRYSATGGAAAVAQVQAETANTAGATQQIPNQDLEASIAHFTEVAAELQASRGMATLPLQLPPTQRQAVQMAQQQQPRHQGSSSRQPLDTPSMADFCTSVPRQLVEQFGNQRSLSDAAQIHDDAADSTAALTDSLRGLFEQLAKQGAAQAPRQQPPEQQQQLSANTRLRAPPSDTLEQQAKTLVQHLQRMLQQRQTLDNSAATAEAAERASGLAAAAQVYSMQADELTAAPGARHMLAGQHPSQLPAAGFPRHSLLHTVQPRTPAMDAAAAGSVAGFPPVPSARMLSFNAAAAAGNYHRQPAATAAAAHGHVSAGKDSFFVLPGADDADGFHQQQQQQRRPRQQQRRRRHRCVAPASDDDSDYLAAEDDEDSADYELSDDGYGFEERPPAHRSARAPRGFSDAAAAASGSGGAQQYPQQLPQVYKSQRWSPAEHAKLVELVAKHGLRNWAVVAAELPGRNGKQCRERYLTHAAKAKRGNWTMAEEYLLASLHASLGNKWVKIAHRMPGRSDNCLKNHWNAVQRSKRLATDRGTSASGSTFLWWYIQRLQLGATPADALAAAVAAVPACEKHLLVGEGLMQQDELQTPTPQAQQQQAVAPLLAADAGAARLLVPAAASAAATAVEGGAESQSPRGAGMQKAADALAAAAAMVVAAAARTKASGRGMPQPAVDALAAAAAAVARAAARDTAELLQPQSGAAAAVAAANAAVVKEATAVYAVPDAAAAAAAAFAPAPAVNEVLEWAAPIYMYNSQQQQQVAATNEAFTAQEPEAATPAAEAAVGDAQQQALGDLQLLGSAAGPAVESANASPQAMASLAAAAPAAVADDAVTYDERLQQALQDANAAAAAGNARSAVAALIAATGLVTRRASRYSPQPKQLSSGKGCSSWPGQQQGDTPASIGLAARQQRCNERLCRLATGALATPDNHSSAAATPSTWELPARRSRQGALELLLGKKQCTDAAAAAAAGGGDGVCEGAATAYPTFLQQQQQQRELWQQQEARRQLLQQQQQDEADDSWEYLPDGDSAAADAAEVPPGYTDEEGPSPLQAQLPAAAATTARPAIEQPVEQMSDAEKQRVLLETLRRLQMIPANAAAGMQLSFSLVVPPAEAPDPAAAVRAADDGNAAAAAAGSMQRTSSGSSHSSESRDHKARLRTSAVGSAMQTATPQGRSAEQQQRMSGSLASAAAAGGAGSTEGLAGGAEQAAQPAVGSKRAAGVALHDSMLSAVAAAKRVLRDAPQWMG